MATEIVVGKRGRITIPAAVRKKYKIEGRLKIIDTGEGILLQPKQSIWASFWDMIGANSDPVTADK
jgi:AbrB family looped-hinge helix DNA binding protein